MIGLFAFMVIPINVDTNQAPITYYGMGTIVHLDADGNEVYKESVHNLLVDEGETFLIDQAFAEGTAGETVDNDQMSSICLTAEVAYAPTEGLIANTFDTNDNLPGTNNCIDGAVDDTTTPQTAIFGPLTFQETTHVPTGTVVTGIGICQGSGATPFSTCEGAQSAPVGLMLSGVAFGTSVTLNAGESLQVTYTFDARTPAS